MYPTMVMRGLGITTASCLLVAKSVIQILRTMQDVAWAAPQREKEGSRSASMALIFYSVDKELHQFILYVGY